MQNPPAQAEKIITTVGNIKEEPLKNVDNSDNNIVKTRTNNNNNNTDIAALAPIYYSNGFDLTNITKCFENF